MDGNQKLKISSDFIFVKLLLVVLMGIIFLLLTDYQRTESNYLTEYIFIFIVLGLLLYYVFTRPNIYYDKDNLYINKGEKLNIQVPLTNIKSISFSIVGFGQGGYSYRIKYLDEYNTIKSVRLFPSMFSSPTSKFIKHTEKLNPAIKITNGSIGINEFFD